MNNKGELQLKDFGVLLLIYTLILTTAASSTNISISDNSSLPLEPESSQSEPEEQQNQTAYSLQPTAYNLTPATYRTELKQHSARVGQKVKWTKRVYTSNQSYKIQIPKNANITPSVKSFETSSESNLSQPQEYLEIIYETSAPQKTELNKSYGKEVKVYSNEHYKNVSVATNIDFNLRLKDKSLLKIYWKEENLYLDFEAFDINNDNQIDQIQWTAPHLSNQTFEIILITQAQHLDENKTFIETIYNEVKELDNIWSPVISSGEYVRVTFEKELDSTKDITIFPRITNGTPRVEVYTQNGTEIIAEFTNPTEGENKIYLTKLTGLHDTFDLKIIGGSMEFDYIVDPSYISLFYEDWETQDFNDWMNFGWAIVSDQAQGTYSASCIEWTDCDMNTSTNTDTSSALEVNISFMYMDDDCDAGDVILYFNDSLGNWDSMGNIDAGTLGTSDDIWNSYIISTTDAQYQHSGFGVRFYGSPGNNENYWLDNINITLLMPGPPNVTLTYPSLNYIYADSSPLVFNATVTAESDLTNCSLWTNHTGTWHLNQTESVTGTLNTTSLNLTLPTDDYFIWNIQCSDSSGQTDWGASNRTVLPDRTPPVVNFTSPTEDNDTSVSQDWIYAEISLVETNFQNITFSLYNSTSLVNQTTFLSQLLNLTWESLPDTTYYYNVTVFDVANNSNSSTTIQIRLDTNAPTGSNIAPLSGTLSKNSTQNLTATFSDEVELNKTTLFVINSTGQTAYTTLISLSGLTSATVGVVYNFPYDDTFTWLYSVQDLAGNEYNTTSSTIGIDTVSPEITLDYPQDSQNFSTYTTSQFNFTVNDESEILNCSLYGNWSGSWHLNQTLTSPARATSINFSAVTVESDNFYSWTVKCVDTHQNTGWNSINFTFAAFLPPTDPVVYNMTQTSNDGLGNITFSWNASNHSAKYEIYAGSTISAMTYLTETTNRNYTDTSCAGQKRRFYSIQATNPTGQNSSEIFGVHLYELKHNTIKSKNWIAFPSNFSSLTTANETLNEVPQATSFTTFNATTQSRVTCNNFSCPETVSCTSTNCNFKLEPGKGYELNINTSESQEINWSAIGRVYEIQTVNLTKNATSFGKNWISMYPNTTLSNAQALIGDITNADAISRWNQDTQESQGLIPSPFPWIPGFIGNNFQLNIEEGYEVSVTTSGTWEQN